MKTKRSIIWIIEDNVMFAETVALVFKEQKPSYRVSLFYAAEDAIVALRLQDPPDLILLDIQLPGMSGIDAIPLIRQATPRTPISMLTVFDDDRNLVESICRGAAGFILKPVTTEDLLNSVERLLAGGSSLSAKVTRRVLRMMEERKSRDKHYDLTLEEQKILQLLFGGMTKNEVLNKLGLSSQDLSSRLDNVYSKLDIHTLNDGVAKAFTENLLR